LFLDTAIFVTVHFSHTLYIAEVI